MPPRFQPTQATTQRPLQNEITTLNKLLGNDILEQVARILDHFAATKENKLEASSFQTPPLLHDKLMQKCEDFETVCDQIYFILEQSKRVLQLEWQQNMIQTKADNIEKEKQLAEVSEQQHQQQSESMDTDMDFESSQMDPSLSMNDTTMSEVKPQDSEPTETIDEEDMEELLQIQRDRLDRLKNVIVFGMDADAVKAKSNGDKEDLLF